MHRREIVFIDVYKEVLSWLWIESMAFADWLLSFFRLLMTSQELPLNAAESLLNMLVSLFIFIFVCALPKCWLWCVDLWYIAWCMYAYVFFSECIEKYGGKYKGGRVNENGLSEFKSNHYCQFIRCLCSYESCNPFQGLNLYWYLHLVLSLVWEATSSPIYNRFTDASLILPSTFCD